MADNLRVSHYRNGDVIPRVYYSSDWAALTIGAYDCYNDDAVMCENWGALYTLSYQGGIIGYSTNQ